MTGRRGYALLGAALLIGLLAGGADAAKSSAERRLTPVDIARLPPVANGAGTSGLHAIQTRLLHGDPTTSGPYTIAITVPPDTVIAAHTHRDDRTAVVVAGVWYFGYGVTASRARERQLGVGSFYTEPGGDPHFARTGAEGATVDITGFGPSDTHDINSPAP
ncbi:hypothetical protein EAH87_05040 [Sphingomonas koreensis]|nr:hypothetical protein EAH87_05040 [Sphingomonas koreensis]